MSQLDLVFPGFGDCFKDVIRAKGGHVILGDCPDPVRICKMGPKVYGSLWGTGGCG